MALYDQELGRNNGTPNYQQLNTAVKLHLDQMMRNRNFKAWNDVVERGSVTKSQKENKAYVERKVGECFQWKAHGQCSKVDSCSFSHDHSLACGNRDSCQRRKGRSSSPASNPKEKQTDGEKGDKEESSDKRSQILCRNKNGNNPSFEFWHLPVCLNYKSEKGCVYSDECCFRHVEECVKHNKKSKEGGVKGSVAFFFEGVYTIGLCTSRFLSEKVFST